MAGAEAVICIESTDLRTLETILLVRDLRSDVRLVAHLDNPAVANAVEEISGAAAVIDVASLFAPAVVEACLKRRAHDIELGDVRFSTVEVTAPRSATLRELYGSLVPLGVTSETDQNPLVCPGRDLVVETGDRVTLLGTAEELDAAGLQAEARRGQRGPAGRHPGGPDVPPARRTAAGRQRSLAAVGHLLRLPAAAELDADPALRLPARRPSTATAHS